MLLKPASDLHTGPYAHRFSPATFLLLFPSHLPLFFQRRDESFYAGVGHLNIFRSVQRLCQASILSERFWVFLCFTWIQVAERQRSKPTLSVSTFRMLPRGADAGILNRFSEYQGFPGDRSLFSFPSTCFFSAFTRSFSRAALRNCWKASLDDFPEASATD